MTFLNYLKAGYPCIWVQTHEEERAIETLSKEAPEYKTFSWDIVSGMRDYKTKQFTVMGDPMRM